MPSDDDDDDDDDNYDYDPILYTAPMTLCWL